MLSFPSGILFSGLVILSILCLPGTRKGLSGWLKISPGGKGPRGGGWRAASSTDGGGIPRWGGSPGCSRGNRGPGACGISPGRRSNTGTMGSLWPERPRGGKFWGPAGGWVAKSPDAFGTFGGCTPISPGLLGTFGGSTPKSPELLETPGGCIPKIAELLRIFGGWAPIIPELPETLDGRTPRISELLDTFGLWTPRIPELLVTLGGCPPKIAELLEISFGITKMERKKQHKKSFWHEKETTLVTTNATISSR